MLGEDKRLTTEGRQGQAMVKTTTHPFHLHDLEVGLLDLVDLVQQLLLPLVPIVLLLITTTTKHIHQGLNSLEPQQQ